MTICGFHELPHLLLDRVNHPKAGIERTRIRSLSLAVDDGLCVCFLEGEPSHIVA